MLFFPAGTLLSLGKLIKEALLSPPSPLFFHLLEVGRHSSSLLLTSVHQIAPRKKEPQQLHSLASASHAPRAVEPCQGTVCKKWNKDYLGSFLGITFAQMSVLQGVSSRHVFTLWSGIISALLLNLQAGKKNPKKPYFSL